MNMPGFTAETSVYQTEGRYRAILIAPSGLPGGQGSLAPATDRFLYVELRRSVRMGHPRKLGVQI